MHAAHLNPMLSRRSRMFTLAGLIGLIIIGFRTLIGQSKPGEIGWFLLRLTLVFMSWQILLNLATHVWKNIFSWLP